MKFIIKTIGLLIPRRLHSLSKNYFCSENADLEAYGYSTMKNYFIKESYNCNLDSQGQPIPFLDDEHNASIYQIKVYEFAKTLICKYKANSILDIGCGYGIKLKKIILPVCNNIVGVDVKHAIDFCKREHNFGRWFEDDIEKPEFALDQKFDIIICSDVIEHLLDPDKLLNYIKRYCHKNTHVIISTPARDLLKGKNGFGPPINKAHVREWSRSEFRRYVSNRGFTVMKHFLVGEANLNLYEIIRKIVLLQSLRNIQVVYCKSESCLRQE